MQSRINLNVRRLAMACVGAGLVVLALLATPSAVAAQNRADGASDPRTTAAAETPSSGSPLLSEPAFLTRAVRLVADRKRDSTAPPKTGFYVEFGEMPTGAGWISAGPGYRYVFGSRALIEGSTAISWHAYKTAQVRFEIGDIRDRTVVAGSQLLWQDLTQVHYWGSGADTLEANSSEYRLKTVDTIGYVDVRPREWVTVSASAGWLHRPMLSTAVGPFDRDYAYTGEVFPDNPAFTLARQPNFIHAEVSATVDTRDHRSYPTAGGLYRAAIAEYSDRDTNLFSFHRYEAEALHVIPVVSDVWALALHGWMVVSDPTPGNQVPLYMEPSLGGGNSLRGFHNYRFHDRNLLLLNAESRVALFTHLDGAVFIDKGNVAPRFRDLDVAKTSYGIGFRVHSDRSTLVRFDIARSSEGWNFLLKMNDPFRFSRLSHRTATVPFVP